MQLRNLIHDELNSRQFNSALKGADGENWVRAPADADPSVDATDEVIGSLAKKKMQSFALVAHGFLRRAARRGRDACAAP